MTLRYPAMILAGILFLSCSSLSKKSPPQQPPPPISAFQEYTYLVFFKKAAQPKPYGWASAFLVKIDSDVYCVTNYHVVTLVDVFQCRFFPPDMQYDSLLFRYSTRSGKVKYLSFPLHKEGSPFYYFDRPDFVLLKLPPTYDTPVYHVCNRWIDQYETANGTPDSVFLFGFN